jgi:hypothetical protein
LVDILTEHIERSAKSEAERRRIIMALDASQPAVLRLARDIRVDEDEKPLTTLTAALNILRGELFDCPGRIDTTANRLECSFERTYRRHEGPLALLSDLPTDELRLSFRVRVTAEKKGLVKVETSASLTTWVKAFCDEICARLTRRHRRPKVKHNPILAPGEILEGPYTGRLLDYSGLARFDEVKDLDSAASEDNILPLGIYAYDHDEDGEIVPSSDRLLCLSRFANRGLMSYNGTLVVAPQNSGKTELIVRWAKAANAKGYSVFLVDVKGELHRRLKKEGVGGRVLFFSTDPAPDIKSDRLNLLDGLDCLTPEGRDEIDQLIEAMLPLHETRDEQGREYWLVRAQWLAAMINLLLLKDVFTREREHPATLADVHRIASSENELVKLILVVQAGFEHLRAKGRATPAPDVSYWIVQLAALLSSERKDIKGGERDQRYHYATLTIGITNLLRPFSEAGVLKARTSGRSDFRLEEINGAAPVTIILAAREQDGEKAKTVLTFVIKRLEQIFYGRRKMTDPTPVLLLLDETRRIRGFEPDKYITFARDAKAGVVLVYQSITQIRDLNSREEILENVGTQIYLRSVTGETAKRLIGLLPEGGRPTFSVTESESTEGASESVQHGQERVPYFTTAELYRLPAGRWPALVYVKDHGPGKPFLVDMDGERIEAAQTARPGAPRAVRTARSGKRVVTF